MPFSLRDVPRLARSPIGRTIIGHGLSDRLEPLLFGLAGLYRRTLTRSTRRVAVVGSFGKTTTTRALKAALGVPWQPIDARNSGSYLASALLKVRPSDRHAVVEVGISAAGQMQRYARLIEPNVVVVTSIGSEHHRTVGGLDELEREKAEMVRSLGRSGLAVLNGDDGRVRRMARQTRARVVMVGFAEDCDVRASDYALDWPYGAWFTVHLGGRSERVHSRLLGRHQVLPILAALAVGQVEGLPLAVGLSRLTTLSSTYGRLEPVRLPSGAWLLRDDRKATEETVDAALDVLGSISSRRKLAVVGELWDPMGDWGTIYRRLGRRIGELVDRAIFVGAASSDYIAGARAAGLPSKALVDVRGDVARAASILREELTPGDVALIVGYGSQRLNRIGLHLTGRRVACNIPLCGTRVVDCPTCPMLERGWGGVAAIF